MPVPALSPALCRPDLPQSEGIDCGLGQIADLFPHLGIDEFESRYRSADRDTADADFVLLPPDVSAALPETASIDVAVPERVFNHYLPDAALREADVPEPLPAIVPAPLPADLDSRARPLVQHESAARPEEPWAFQGASPQLVGDTYGEIRAKSSNKTKTKTTAKSSRKSPNESPTKSGAKSARHRGRELWLVSTRNACWVGNCIDGTEQLQFFRFAHGQWKPSTRKRFLASDDPAVPTTFYAHGNDVGGSEAFFRGLTVFRQLGASVPNKQRFRLVCISWPSAQELGKKRQDLQLKAYRSEAHAYYLAWLMRQVHPAVPQSLLGYSYGARMVSSALHLLAGGEVAGRRLPATQRVHAASAGQSGANHRGYGVVLFAAAMDSFSLYPGHQYERALSQVDRLIVTRNSCDRVLKWYPWLYHRGGPDALGYTGLPSWAMLGPGRERIGQMDVSSYAGKEHSWEYYEGSSYTLSRVTQYLYYKPDPRSAETQQKRSPKAVRSATGGVSALAKPVPHTVPLTR